MRETFNHSMHNREERIVVKKRRTMKTTVTPEIADKVEIKPFGHRARNELMGKTRKVRIRRLVQKNLSCKSQKFPRERAFFSLERLYERISEVTFNSNSVGFKVSFFV